MSDEQTPALEAGDEVVSEAIEQEAEAPEAAESTEGQVETPPAEGDEQEAPDETPEEEVSPSKARRERRKAEMERLRKEAAEAEAENAKLKEQLAVVERRKGQPAPREADFEDYAEYQAALAAHKAIQALDTRDSERIEGEAQAKQQRLEALRKQQAEEMAQDWAAQAAEARERYSDFDQVVAAPDVSITESMAKLITSLEHGADVAYHLGTNKAEAAAIAAMPPIEQAMAIGRLEAAVSRPNPRIQTKAPNPIKPVKPKASINPDPGKMTPEEYDKWRDAGGTFTL